MSLKDFSRYENVVSQMEGSIKAGRVSHAYIIEGSSLSNKFEVAINFIKAIICKESKGIGCDACLSCRKVDSGNYEDLHIVELMKGKSFIVVDQIEEMVTELSKKAFSEEGYKFVVIKDADRMNKIAQNKILKTLEEPLEKTVIILLSENDNNLLQTIRSRCIIYRLNENHNDNNCENQRDKIYLSGDKDDDDVIQEEMSIVAAEILNQRIKKENYYKSFKYLDEKISNKQEAEYFLDSLTYLFRAFLIGQKKSPLSLEKIGEGIVLIEEARKDLKYNVNYQYALKTLILKIGG